MNQGNERVNKIIEAQKGREKAVYFLSDVRLLHKVTANLIYTENYKNSQDNGYWSYQCVSTHVDFWFVPFFLQTKNQEKT